MRVVSRGEEKVVDIFVFGSGADGLAATDGLTACFQPRLFPKLSVLVERSPLARE